MESGLPACLLRHWIHSHEEDTLAVQVYRPAEYPFPPSRGRTGFAFLPEGELVAYGIAPADGVSESRGSWTFIPPRSISIQRDDAIDPPLTLDVVSCSEYLLAIAAS